MRERWVVTRVERGGKRLGALLIFDALRAGTARGPGQCPDTPNVYVVRLFNLTVREKEC